jgi:hypothetical protein
MQRGGGGGGDYRSEYGGGSERSRGEYGGGAADRSRGENGGGGRKSGGGGTAERRDYEYGGGESRNGGGRGAVVSARAARASEAINQVLYIRQCCGSMKFWYGSGSADPYPWIRMRIRILLFSSVIFKTSKKILSFFAYYFLNVHLHHFSKIKSHKEVILNSKNQCLNYYF